jgi:DNA-binding NarL/FixJ family response regulator
VFRLIGRGAATKEIARLLGLERTTVESHRKEISRRLGVSGAELVRLAALQVCHWPGGGG